MMKQRRREEKEKDKREAQKTASGAERPAASAEGTAGDATVWGQETRCCLGQGDPLLPLSSVCRVIQGSACCLPDSCSDPAAGAWETRARGAGGSL